MGVRRAAGADLAIEAAPSPPGKITPALQPAVGILLKREMRDPGDLKPGLLEREGERGRREMEEMSRQVEMKPPVTAQACLPAREIGNGDHERTAGSQHASHLLER